MLKTNPAFHPDLIAHILKPFDKRQYVSSQCAIHRSKMHRLENVFRCLLIYNKLHHTESTVHSESIAYA